MDVKIINVIFELNVRINTLQYYIITVHLKYTINDILFGFHGLLMHVIVALGVYAPMIGIPTCYGLVFICLYTVLSH